jgi:hypothetical protein
MRRKYRTAAGALLALALGAGSVAPAMAQSGAVTRSYMVGRWTDDGNCANASSFARNGTFRTGAGQTGFWHLDGGRLILSGERTLALGVAAVDRDHINVVNPDGTPGRSSRCPGGESGAAAAIPIGSNYLVGRWTDIDDCSNNVAFVRGGNFVTSAGAEGRWSLAGDRLTMSGATTMTVRIAAIDPNIMMVINPDGALGRSTRC